MKISPNSYSAQSRTAGELYIADGAQLEVRLLALTAEYAVVTDAVYRDVQRVVPFSTFMQHYQPFLGRDENTGEPIRK
jgi:hypothetical protein